MGRNLAAAMGPQPAPSYLGAKLAEDSGIGELIFKAIAAIVFAAVIYGVNSCMADDPPPISPPQIPTHR